MAVDRDFSKEQVFFFPACKVVTESLLALLREQAIEKPYLPTLFTKPEVKFVLIRPSLDKVLIVTVEFITHPVLLLVYL